MEYNESDGYQHKKGNITVGVKITPSASWELLIKRENVTPFNIRISAVETTVYNDWLSVIMGIDDVCIICGSSYGEDVAEICKKDEMYVFTFGNGDINMQIYVSADELDESLYRVIVWAHDRRLIFASNEDLM